MLNEAQQTQAWEERLRAEMRAAYFADLCGAYRARQRWATLAVLILSSGAAAGLLARLSWLPPWLPAAFAMLAAAMSAYLLVAQNIQSATECSDLHFRWNRLALKYEDIWNNMHASNAGARLAATNEQRLEVSKSGTAFAYSEKRMLRWHNHVVQEHSQRAA